MNQDQVDEVQSVEEELQNLIGQSWFDIEENFRKSTSRKSLTRIVFTSLIDSLHDKSPSTKNQTFKIASNIHDFFNAFTKGEADEERIELFGGVIIANGEENETMAALGFLEVDSPPSAFQILKSLNENSDSIYLHSIRILLVSDDCPCNDFGTFGVYITNPPTEDNVDIKKEGQTVVFSNIMKNLCKQCKVFYSESEEVEKGSSVKILNGLNRKSIPSALRIESCAKSDAYPTLEEYMQIFHSPICLELDSEKCSPILPVVDWKQVERITSSLFQK